MIIVKNLSFKFSNEKEYLFKNFSATFKRNTIHYIIGENGSGKSTFLNLLNKPKMITHSGKQTKINTSIVSQDYKSMLVLPFTAQENLTFSRMKTHPGMNKMVGENEKDILEETSIFPMNIPVENLSGGQKQILAISMKLQKNTDVLLLDEPTAALDEKNAKFVFSFLKNLVKEKNVTIFVICHKKKYIQNFRYSTCIEIKKENNKAERTFIQKNC
jgi:ABC-type lipoprotein export system ATPase subunit